MKIRVTFKTPDVVDEACDEALANYRPTEELDMYQQEEYVKQLAVKFFRHTEYVTLELDTDEQTAVVVPSAEA